MSTYEPFTTPGMTALFSPASHVRHMLMVEGALARAAAAVGAIPDDAAAAIAERCVTGRFDVDAIYREAAIAGTPAIPLVRMLTEQVGPDAGRFVHIGATSQDVIDSALALQMRAGLDLLIDDLALLCAACAEHAEQHRHTVMAGRTLLQHATPITFGLKAARWLALCTRQLRELHHRREHALALQFGGAAGTLAALGENGWEIAEQLSIELKLPLPALPWHAERDRFACIAATLGITAGAIASIATDIVLLTQTEVGEVAEASAQGKGISSAMPQKKNPVDSGRAIAAARLAMAQVPVLMAGMVHEHERGIAWPAEWSALPAVFGFTAGALASLLGAVQGLEVDGARMRANIETAGGMLMAESLATLLARHIGKPAAQSAVQALAASAASATISLRDAALTDESIRALLTVEDIERALDPAAYLGSSDRMIDRALASWRVLKPNLAAE